MQQYIYNTEDCFPLAHKSMLSLVFQYRGTIFGGYLRDIWAGVSPRDLDVVICKAEWTHFDSDVMKLYTQREYNKEHETYVYKQPGLIDLEVLVINDDPDDTYFGPLIEPDFHVNLLSYSQETKVLTTWDDSSSLEEVKEILVDISARVARYRCDPEDLDCERLLKIKEKGYTVNW